MPRPRGFKKSDLIELRDKLDSAAEAASSARFQPCVDFTMKEDRDRLQAAYDLLQMAVAQTIGRIEARVFTDEELTAQRKGRVEAAR